MAINDPLDDPPEPLTLDPGLGPDPDGGAGTVSSPTLPLPPPRDRDELEQLLIAVATTPDGDRGLIRETIAGFESRAEVAALLHDALHGLPAVDVARHLMVLAIIGELRHESSVEPLERFVWLADEDVHGPGLGEEQDDAVAGSVFAPVSLLQARAAEMLVWVAGRGYSDGVRRILGNHPSDAVRIATVDAWSFAHDDDPSVLDGLRGLVREEDRWAVGLPRKDGTLEPADFDAAVEAHTAEFGGETGRPAHGEQHDDVQQAPEAGGRNVR